MSIRRPWQQSGDHDRSGPRVNRAIRVREIFLINEAGESIGPTPTDQAMRMAEAAGLDLVEINPNARPPVCKILDYGKYKYAQQKKKSGQKSRQSKLKEIRLHPTTSEHDVQVRLRQARKFLDHNDKVLIVCWFKGREMAHREFGMRLMEQFKKEFALDAKVEREPSMEGSKMIMLLTPLAEDVRKKMHKEAEAMAARRELEEKSHGSGRQRRVITREEAERERASHGKEEGANVEDSSVNSGEKVEH